MHNLNVQKGYVLLNLFVVQLPWQEVLWLLLEELPQGRLIYACCIDGHNLYTK